MLHCFTSQITWYSSPSLFLCNLKPTIQLNSITVASITLSTLPDPDSVFSLQIPHLWTCSVEEITNQYRSPLIALSFIQALIWCDNCIDLLLAEKSRNLCMWSLLMLLLLLPLFCSQPCHVSVLNISSWMEAKTELLYTAGDACLGSRSCEFPGQLLDLIICHHTQPLATRGQLHALVTSQC